MDGLFQFVEIVPQLRTQPFCVKTFSPKLRSGKELSWIKIINLVRDNHRTIFGLTSVGAPLFLEQQDLTHS
jgi:hypothetical protein